MVVRMAPLTALMPSVPTFHVVVMRPTAVSAETTIAAWIGEPALRVPPLPGRSTRVGIPGAT